MENQENNQINTSPIETPPEEIKSQPEAVLGVTGEDKGEDKTENTAEKVQIGKPFQKGDDPRRNLGGRPLGVENFKTIFERALKRLADVNQKDPDELYEEIISNGLKSARSGDFKFYKDLLDRIYGKPKESIDHTTGGEKLNQKMEWVIVRGRKDEEHS
jgi:hypothetical protein